MPQCDGFFEENGIPYLDSFADEAVHAVWRTFYRDRVYAKFLIMCWYDTTYLNIPGTEERRPESRTQMSRYLETTPFRSFEDLLEAKEDWRIANNQSTI